jgi:hypothetical protein
VRDVKLTRAERDVVARGAILYCPVCEGRLRHVDAGSLNESRLCYGCRCVVRLPKVALCAALLRDRPRRVLS